MSADERTLEIQVISELVKLSIVLTTQILEIKARLNRLDDLEKPYAACHSV